MKKLALVTTLLCGSASVYAGDALELCLITGEPPSGVQYESVKKLRIGKNSYGSVTDILPAFAEQATTLGANAVVNYVGSQRFGFWPWRFVRPVVRGEAVRLHFNENQTCDDIGGATVKRVIETNKEPHLI